MSQLNVINLRLCCIFVIYFFLHVPGATALEEDRKDRQRGLFPGSQ